jgi:hypothetical protein
MFSLILLHDIMCAGCYVQGHVTRLLMAQARLLSIKYFYILISFRSSGLIIYYILINLKLSLIKYYIIILKLIKIIKIIKKLIFIK